MHIYPRTIIKEPYKAVMGSNLFDSRVSGAEIDEFREIWRKEFGYEISKDDAREKSLGLIKIMRLALRVSIEEDHGKEKKDQGLD